MAFNLTVNSYESLSLVIVAFLVCSLVFKLGMELVPVLRAWYPPQEGGAVIEMGDLVRAPTGSTVSRARTRASNMTTTTAIARPFCTSNVPQFSFFLPRWLNV
ncbi:hypothetical protein LXA43DRAFT_1100814 [Ganoderma leucocontextum]|nr:hypothetical protein LXA43DRAFT_1100814 [Ganoderma leucocontextum]